MSKLRDSKHYQAGAEDPQFDRNNKSAHVNGGPQSLCPRRLESGHSPPIDMRGISVFT